MRYKWLNEDQDQVVRYEEGENPVTIPLSRFDNEGISEWLDEGNEIEPYKTSLESTIDETLSWEIKRDELERNAILLYDGNLFFMTPRARQNMDASRGSLERGKELNWPCYDPNTGEKRRVKISKVEFDKFEDALFDAIDLLHTQADTQMPDNPWPLEVI